MLALIAKPPFDPSEERNNVTKHTHIHTSSQSAILWLLVLSAIDIFEHFVVEANEDKQRILKKTPILTMKAP
jgi:hypothetical protein